MINARHACAQGLRYLLCMKAGDSFSLRGGKKKKKEGGGEKGGERGGGREKEGNLNTRLSRKRDNSTRTREKPEKTVQVINIIQCKSRERRK